MNNIQKLIEAEKKTTEGPWVVDGAICPEHDSETLAIYHNPSKFECVEVVEVGCNCSDDAIKNPNDAQFIAAARNAMPEIVELVGLIRPHWLSSGPIVIDEEYANRIRELVGK